MTKDELKKAIDDIYQMTQSLLNTIMPIDSGFIPRETREARMELLDILPQIMIRQVGRNDDGKALLATVMLMTEFESILSLYRDEIASGQFRKMMNESQGETIQ